MEEENWTYEKLMEDGTIKTIDKSFVNDTDGSITGHIVMNVHAYFDENPSERIRLGWTKHITHNPKDVDYNHQTQFLTMQTHQVDDWTIEDAYYILDKSEDQLAFE